MRCEQSRQVHAYHDGELGVEDRRAMEQHLRQCTDCARELQELQGLSQLLASGPLPRIPAAALRRLHNHAEAMWEGGVLRIAEALTGLAAAILVAGLILLWRDQPAAASPTTAWEWAMVDQLQDEAPPPSEAGNGAGDPMQIAMWMTQAVSPSTDHE